jgi:predicted SnoaL-like aldol condensation-catalyzing enzyme
MMSTQPVGAEMVVRKHLYAFLQGQGADAIVSDYDQGAKLFTESHVFIGKPEIHRFFTQFLDALPPGAIERFKLKSLHADGTIAFITWSVTGDIPLGTDTFVVVDGRIVSQTFAMHGAPDPVGSQR